MTTVIDVQDTRTGVTALRPADIPDLLAMHDRCTMQTRYRRWHGQLRAFPARYLAALLDPSDDHIGLVARRDGQLVGLASAARTDARTREIGILVEDAWQRRGVGRELIIALVAESLDRGSTKLVLETLADDGALLEPLRTLGPIRTRMSHGVLHAVLELRAS